MNFAERNKFGREGEDIACKYLLKKGLKFIEKNYRFHRHEIDLIFEDEKNRILIFIEVKTRKNKIFGEPEEAITYTKQKHIRNALYGYLMKNPSYSDYDLRVDTICIMYENDNHNVNHIENAFN
jgi:putative endonuclease